MIKVVIKRSLFKQIRHEPRFALSITLSRVINSLISTWRTSLGTGESRDKVAERERLQAFLNNSAFLYEGIQAFFNNQQYLKDLNCYKSHSEEIKLLNREVSLPNSFYNIVMSAVRNKITFHFNRDSDLITLLDPNYELRGSDNEFEDPIVYAIGYSDIYGESVHLMADKLIEQFIASKIKEHLSKNQDRNEKNVLDPPPLDELWSHLKRLDEIQNAFVDIVGHLVAEILQGYGAEVIKETDQGGEGK